MLTPQEIQEKGFTKAVFGGFVMEEVDEFMEAVYTDYYALYRENAILKSKIKVLVEKLEEYRASDQSMRTTLATAQKNTEAMYRETREKCRRLTRDTDDKVKKTIAEMNAKIAAEERRLANISANADQYAAAIRKVMDKQEECLKELTKISEEAKAANPKQQNAPQEQNKAPKQHQKKEKKPLPPLPQPDIDLSIDDSTDTETAEEINDIVSTILNETKTGDLPKVKEVPKAEEKTSADDKFDFKSMKFN